jgi:hypothetical protein
VEHAFDPVGDISRSVIAIGPIVTNATEGRGGILTDRHFIEPGIGNRYRRECLNHEQDG